MNKKLIAIIVSACIVGLALGAITAIFVYNSDLFTQEEDTSTISEESQSIITDIDNLDTIITFEEDAEAIINTDSPTSQEIIDDINNLDNSGIVLNENAEDILAD